MLSFCLLMGKLVSNLLLWYACAKCFFSSIRNYMSKPWFLNIALESEATPLADTISKILAKPEEKTDKKSWKPSNAEVVVTQSTAAL